MTIRSTTAIKLLLGSPAILVRRTKTTQLSKADWTQSRQRIGTPRLLAIFISLKRSLITSSLAQWLGCPAHVRGASEPNESSFNDVLHAFAELGSISVTEQLLSKLQRRVPLCGRYIDWLSGLSMTDTGRGSLEALTVCWWMNWTNWFLFRWIIKSSRKLKIAVGYRTSRGCSTAMFERKQSLSGQGI